jgi:hypothetical protein
LKKKQAITPTKYKINETTNTCTINQKQKTATTKQQQQQQANSFQIAGQRNRFASPVNLSPKAGRLL